MCLQIFNLKSYLQVQSSVCHRIRLHGGQDKGFLCVQLTEIQSKPESPASRVTFPCLGWLTTILIGTQADLLKIILAVVWETPPYLARVLVLSHTKTFGLKRSECTLMYLRLTGKQSSRKSALTPCFSWTVFSAGNH